MFTDRKDAGRKLARALEKYKDTGIIVLAIPRGGAPVGYEAAKYLNAEFSILVARKLPFPDNPESGFGAIAEDGSTFIFEDAAKLISPEEIDEIKKEQIEEINRRIKVLRQSLPLPDIKNKTVILIDDGLAMSSTMRTAIALCRNKGAGKIVMAVPVASRDAAIAMKELADETIILEIPPFFQAVAEVYKNWYDVPDDEVISILKEQRHYK